MIQQPSENPVSSQPVIPLAVPTMPSGNLTLFSASNVNLPPLSSRLIKALKDKDYVDLSSTHATFAV